MSKLLFDEPPIAISPTLATILSLNEAVVLQQVHYYVELAKKTNHNYVDGRYWVYNTYEEWRDRCFPFWSLNTIKRTFASLENSGIIVSANHNKSGLDKRKWYSINYDVLDSKVSDFENRDKEEDTDRPKMGRSNDPKCTNLYNIYNNIDNKTKTSTKNTLNVLNGTSCDKHKDVRCIEKPFDQKILERQVIGCCHNIGIMDVTEIDTLFKVIRCYYAKYRSTFGEDHPNISNGAMVRVIDALHDKLNGGYEPNELCELIDQHFNTVYGGMGTDYNICHFCSGEIMQNRSYEVFGV